MKKFRDFFKKYFITGLLVIIPIWATYYVLSALLGIIDDMLGDLPGYLLGLKFPGLGIITLILFVLLIGILTANYLGKKLVQYGETLMQKVPLVRGVYSTMKKIMETFSMKHNFHGVALVEYPRKGLLQRRVHDRRGQGRVHGTGRKVHHGLCPHNAEPHCGFSAHPARSRSHNVLT